MSAARSTMPGAGTCPVTRNPQHLLHPQQIHRASIEVGSQTDAVADVADVAVTAGATAPKLNLSREAPELGPSIFSKVTDNPMQPKTLARAPRCGAQTRSGQPCLSPAVRGRQRCRMHGGTNKGAPEGNRNAWKHGNRSQEAQVQLAAVRVANRNLRALAKLGKGHSLNPAELDCIFGLLRNQ